MPFAITTDAPLEVIPTPGGFHIRNAEKPSFWAKITGKCDVGSGSSSGSGDSTCEACYYAWVEVVEEDDCTAVELTSQASETEYPALEITGRSDVPDDAIVRMYPSRNGARYTFLYTSPPAPCADESTICFRADLDPRCVSGAIVSDDHYLVIPQCVADAFGIYISDTNPCDTGSGS